MSITKYTDPTIATNPPCGKIHVVGDETSTTRRRARTGTRKTAIKGKKPTVKARRQSAAKTKR